MCLPKRIPANSAKASLVKAQTKGRNIYSRACSKSAMRTNTESILGTTKAANTVMAISSICMVCRLAMASPKSRSMRTNTPPTAPTMRQPK